MSKSHDDLGKVLRCHLIIEHYLGEHLKNIHAGLDLKALHLKFFQKVAMMPKRSGVEGQWKAGIRELGKVRNNFAHDLDYDIIDKDITNIKHVVQRWHKEVKGSPIHFIVSFTGLGCTYLMPKKFELDAPYRAVFSHMYPGIND